MNEKLWRIILVTVLTLVMLGVVVAVAQGPASRLSNSPDTPDDNNPLLRSVVAGTQLTPTRFLTVTSTSDEIDSVSQRCEQASPCTLRRAINEVRYYQFDDETYRIAFDIDTNDPGYDSSNEVWVIEVDSDNSDINFAFRDFGTYGHLLIDGSTQPIGRDLSVGPRIVLRGDNEKGGFTLTGGDNIIRGLAFQGFGDRMVSVPDTSNNLIEKNWFGLTITGTEVFLRDPEDPEKGSGESGIYVQSGGSNNTVQDNILTGLDQGAITMDGEQSYVLDNTVGTRSDGTVPEIRWERKCRPNARYHNWFGGAGIQIYGDNHLVQGNRVVAMLYQSADPLSTPEDALSVTGEGHIVRDNIIGVDAGDQSFGVCGEGIHVGGAFGGHYVQVVTNTLVGSRGAAGILVTGGVYGYDLNAVTVRANVITGSAVTAFAFGDTLPSELRLFNPAAVTSIGASSVSGTSGADSPCADCIVELFLDEIDTVTETLESLAIVTADGSGNWTAPLPRALAINEGIRTASTTVVKDQISHPSSPGYFYDAGTTTKISELYVQDGAPDPTPAPDPVLEPPLPIPSVVYAPPPSAPSAFTTIITVTSAADPDDSSSYTCSADLVGPPGPAPDGRCTLRRALLEADGLMDEDPGVRPILIRFDIPTSDDGYDGAGTWIIELYDTSQLTALPTLGSTDIEKSGQVVISGTTQPDYGGLRPDMPRIVVRGADGSKNGLVINGEGNVVQGLAFQRFKDILTINHSGNTIQDNWFGLTVDGLGMYLRDQAQPQEGSGDAAIAVASASNNNLIQNNVFLGVTGAAINMQGGDDNYVLDNFIGTRADGTIDVANVDPANICDPTADTNNWFGGEGINLRGKRNQVTGNILVGLLLQGSASQTPPDAINVSSGQDNLIQNNRIGRDATGTDVWTCGSGVDLVSGYNQVFSNTIVSAYKQAIFINGTTIAINANQMQGNVISNTVAAVEFGDIVADALRFFDPALVTLINGVNVSGASDDDCPYCWVDVYLDNDDDIVEALAYLGSAIADANGDWTLTLPAPLDKGQGLRTISTVRNYGVIEYFEAGTSSKLSALFQGGSVFLPLVLR